MMNSREILTTEADRRGAGVGTSGRTDERANGRTDEQTKGRRKNK